MKRLFLLIAITGCFCAGFLAGCSSSEETADDQHTNDSGEFQHVDADEDVIPTTDAPEKEDVPAVEKNIPVQNDNYEQSVPAKQESENQPAAARSGLIMWSVQLGAFKLESGATQLINELKNKFNQPVYKEYDPVSGFYKVTIGSFQTREQASQYKSEIQAKGYPDAFSVEVRR